MSRFLSSRVEKTTVREFLDDLAFENPAPEEKWFQRDAFDPMHSAAEIRAAAKRGLVELEISEDPDCWRFRLTSAGRADLDSRARDT